MKKINTEKYTKYTEDDKKIILSFMIPKRHRFFTIGTLFGFCTIVASIIGFICLFALKTSVYSNLWFIPEVAIVCGISSIIGGLRNKKEGELYQTGDFKIRKGYIKSVEKRNSWSNKITIKYSEKDEEIFSQIGHNFKQNDKVYIAITNQEKTPWVLPRIIKR